MLKYGVAVLILDVGRAVTILLSVIGPFHAIVAKTRLLIDISQSEIGPAKGHHCIVTHLSPRENSPQH